MSRRCAYTHLRLLVEAARRLYPVTRQEPPKALLISLHKVLSEIQLLKHRAADGSETESEVEEDEKRSYCGCEEDCVNQIVGDMVLMLGTGSEFVQHSAVNVLVNLFELMAESEKDWETFFSSVNGCLEMAMSNGLSCSSAASNIDCHNLVTVNWPVLSSIIQIYRKILKILKLDYEEQLVQSTFDGHPEICYIEALAPKLKMLLLGNLLQLLCSLADRGYYSDSVTSLELRHQVLEKIQNLVPLLSSWCLDSPRIVSSSSIHHYLKHKFLMLMVRLVDEIPIDRAICRSCLKLLHNYFEDDLNQKLALVKVADNACLQDSPFWQSAYVEGVCKASQQHLQRLAILLFLKCTVTMITLDAKRNVSCVCTNSLTSAELEVRCCDGRKGVSELYTWLLGQNPIDSYVNCESYFEMCMSFASSLLQLFVNEDDMLFQVLLQVFTLPCTSTQLFQEDNFSLQEVKCDIIFHISNIFNPMLLFHIFLSKLEYDHQILLDYLISKDVGLSCAEYLLKCLRRVSESWSSFMQYSYEKVSIQSKKKRKIFPKVTEKDRDETFVLWDSGKAFEQAKQCLLSLRMSVESLHRRRLFPYNAEVLLKRLRRFEELCLIEENQNLREPSI